MDRSPTSRPATVAWALPGRALGTGCGRFAQPADRRGLPGGSNASAPPHSLDKAERKQLDEALALARRAATLRPSEPLVLYALGSVHEARQERAQAEETFRKLIRLDPTEEARAGANRHPRGFSGERIHDDLVTPRLPRRAPGSRRLLLLYVAGGIARVLLHVPLFLSTFRTSLLVSRLALGLDVACVLTAVLPRIPGILPILPSILPPLRARGLRVTRCKLSERPHGESQRQHDRPKPNCGVHLPLPWPTIQECIEIFRRHYRT